MAIRIHVIAPYEAMFSVIKECAQQFPNLTIDISIGDLQNGVDLAKAVQHETDIFISRGGTAKMIQQAVTVPVIDMHLSGYDLMRSLILASNFQDKTAIVGFSNITSSAQAIIELMNLQLNVYTVNEASEVAPLIVQLKNKGYKQIVGDMITYRTSNLYGMKGFLIQSGKESILQAMEDAEKLYSYLYQQQAVSVLFEKLALEHHQNVLIFENNLIVYEQLRDFENNPFTDEIVSMLQTDLTINKGEVTQQLVIEENIMEITAKSYVLENKTYTLLLFEKNTLQPFDQVGIHLYKTSSYTPVFTNSPAIRFTLHQLTALYKKRKPIVLIGEKGTGKRFIAMHIHHEYSKDGYLVAIDFDKAKLADVLQLPFKKIRTLILQNVPPKQTTLNEFFDIINAHPVHCILLSEKELTAPYTNKIDWQTVTVPPLAERQEDLHYFVHYFLTATHEQYGTVPVKMNDEAFQLLQQHIHSHNLDDLENVIKEISFYEQDYVIQPETVQLVLQKQTPMPNLLQFTGTLKNIEKQIIEAVLREENFNQTKTAQRLGINRATLWRKLKE